MVASQDSSAPLVAIIGATGVQGGSVFEHLARSDKSYRLRAITRDPSKPSADALRQKGAEVVAGDLGDKASIGKAFAGAEIVFGMTNYWAYMSTQKEIEEGKTMIDAAKAAGVKTFVWSGLENVSEVTKGKITAAEHFDGKGVVTEYGKKSGLNFRHVSPGWFAENLLGMMGPRKQEDGTFVIAQAVKPTTKIPIINCAKDYGAYVREAIEAPAFNEGSFSEVLAASEEVTFPEIAEIIGKASDKTVNFFELPDELLLQSVPAPVNQDLLAMSQWFREYGYYAGKDIGPSNAHIAPDARPQTFAEFAKEVDWSKVLV